MSESWSIRLWEHQPAVRVNWQRETTGNWPIFDFSSRIWIPYIFMVWVNHKQWNESGSWSLESRGHQSAVQVNWQREITGKSCFCWLFWTENNFKHFLILDHQTQIWSSHEIDLDPREDINQQFKWIGNENAHGNGFWLTFSWRKLISYNFSF